jgi:hypothetical protein
MRARNAFAARLVRMTGVLAIALVWPAIAHAQWTKVNGAPNASTCLLLTDGTVLCQEGEKSHDWQTLTPDSSGAYENGTWTKVKSFPSTYGPLYYASAVLADGRVLVIGGEYDDGGTNETTDGYIYDPTNNSWTFVTAPSGWAQVGDSPSVVLPDGTFVLGDHQSARMAKFNPGTLDFTALSTSGKADGFGEEGMTLLPDGTALSVEAGTEGGTGSEFWTSSTGQWASAGSTIVSLPDYGTLGPGYVPELGPAVLRPDGTVIATGATLHNSLYSTSTGLWTAVDDFPTEGSDQMVAADAPASLLPSGNVLVAASKFFSGPTHFYEFDGLHFNKKTDPSNNGRASYQSRLLLLPTGQVMHTNGTNDVQLYMPGGTPSASWAPAISPCPKVAVPNHANYSISGTQFNGMSQANSYGDDTQNATNYPLVRITNHKTGHVFFARTHDHSSMGVATGSTVVSTSFDTPVGMESGPADLVVIANGIVSGACDVNDNPPVTTASLSGPLGSNGWFRGAVTVTLTATDLDGAGNIDATYYAVDGGSQQTYSGPFVVSGDAIHSVSFFTKDKDGNEETPHPSVAIKIDGTNPTLAFGAANPPANGFGWNNGSVSIPYTTADNLSGVATSVPGNPLHFTSEGAGQTQSVLVTDVAGNSQSFTSPAVNIDLTPPTVTVSASDLFIWSPNHKLVPDTISGKMSDGLSGLQAGTASFKVVDEYGFIQPTGAISLAGDGSFSFVVMLDPTRLGADLDGRHYTVTVTVKDKADNTASATVVITVPHNQPF